MPTGPPAGSIDWKRVQEVKRDCLRLAARHAMEQQKRDRLPTASIPFPARIDDGPRMKVTEKNPDAIRIAMTDIQAPYGQAMGDIVRFRLERPLNLLDGGSGLVMTVRTESGASREVRLGMRLIATGGQKAATILPYIPVANAWGDNPHEIYFDWSFLNYGEVREAIEVLQSVEAIELLSGSALRAPERGASRTPQSATAGLSDLRLVDYLQGSYDPARHRWSLDREPDLTLQHRCQEVTGLVAYWGGEEGLRSATESLDLCVRTQCWDGSFLDGRRGARTVTSGEYTHGFTIYGTLNGYLALEEAGAPCLDEAIAVGPRTMPRRELYQRMFYRAAMSRAGIALPPDYRDDIIGGNTLITGANRVKGYAIAMHMAADAMRDPEKRRAILERYHPLMDAIVEGQGQYSGGFPVLAEGDRYQGAGIHYDSGYIRTHMDWLVVGLQRTGDPRFTQILRRYQEVFEAAMDSRGTGLVPLLSERHEHDEAVKLIVPNSTAQVGLRHGLPLIAQWGYNCSLAAWGDPERPEGNFWLRAREMRGYPLGAFAVRLLDDYGLDIEPRDLGYLFPRQYPIWSSRFYTKEGDLVRTSRVHVHPDGTMWNDFRIEVGEYPKTVGVPVQVESPEGVMLATALELSGWPRLLPEGAEFTVSVEGREIGKVRADQPVQASIGAMTEITIAGPDVDLPPEAGGETVPFRAVLSLEPGSPGQVLAVALRVLRGTVPYVHRFHTPQVN